LPLDEARRLDGEARQEAKAERRERGYQAWLQKAFDKIPLAVGEMASFTAFRENAGGHSDTVRRHLDRAVAEGTLEKMPAPAGKKGDWYRRLR
jgi:hypothetical protein